MLKTTDGTQYKRIPGLPGDRMPTTGFQKKRALYTATGGETTINLALLSPSLSCIPGMNQIAIKRSSGGALITGVDFYETNSTTITFPSSDPLIAGEIVEISQEAMVTGIAALTARPDCYTATATAGQTSIICDFSWPYNLNSGKAIGGVSLYINGVLQTRGIDFTEVNLGTANTNQIDLSLGGPLVGGENIIAVPTYQAMDTSAATSGFYGSAYSGLQSMMAAGTQNFVDQSTDMISVPNTTIIGRAKIPNLANDLRASFGIERISVQQIMQLQNEFGLSGEPVYAAVNDDRGLIRFVGSGWSTLVAQNGPFAYNSGTLNDYFEITFYGTHLNLLIAADAADLRMSIDGGLESANIITSQSTILYNRGYSANIVQAAVPIQTLGIHTVKFKIGTAGDVIIHGFEILNSNASGYININTGTAYANGSKIVKSAASAIAYNTGVTGTRGGRVVRYLNSDGTIGQAFTPVNAAAAYLTAADHTNEEVVRTYHWREFGAGRSDDFSSLAGTPSDRAFTLEDGTTTLVGKNVANGLVIPQEGLSYSNASGNFITLTFVGTGLDVVLQTDASTRQFDSVSVDGGSSLGALTVTGASPSSPKKTYKVASGLVYGTHTVKLYQAANTYSPGLFQFIVYQPKKPAIPTAALELCDYNVMGDFASCNAGDTTIATGVLRKNVTREMVYVGSGWSVFSTLVASGFLTMTVVNGDYLQYTFFGTGFSYRFQNGGAQSITAQMTLTDAANPSGTTNFSGFTVATNGGGISSFTAATATLVTTTTGVEGNVVSVSGMPLGWHTIKITRVSSTGTVNFYQHALDIITPIHAVKSNLYADLQNTLPVGSCSLMDSRKISMIKEALPVQKAWAQAVGVASNPTTGSTSMVPMPDMSVTVKTSGGAIRISYKAGVYNSAVANNMSSQVYLNGSAIGTASSINSAGTSYAAVLSDSFIVPCAPGVHKIDLYWMCNLGTNTALTTQRSLTVQEL